MSEGEEPMVLITGEAVFAVAEGLVVPSDVDIIQYTHRPLEIEGEKKG